MSTAPAGSREPAKIDVPRPRLGFARLNGIRSALSQRRPARSAGEAIMARRNLALVVAALTAALAFCASAAAQSYPTRPIRVIVPYTAGSPNDVIVRLLAQRLEPKLGQPLVMDNRPGGGTVIGTKAAATAEPDGYTLLFSSSSLVIEPALNTAANYDPQKDFAPIATVGTTVWVLAITPRLPATTIAEFVAWSKRNPGQVNFGFAQGTASQLVGGRFKVLTGADILDVPYKGGAAALPDFLGGRIQMLLPTPSTSLAMIRDGRMRALAITSATRSPDLPDVPTFAELGLPDLTLAFWAGMLAPAGTPPDVIHRIQQEVAKALNAPAVRERLQAQGAEPVGNTPEQFAAFIRAETAKWAKVVKDSGAKVD
jgi:tripartite-type tricarboxylate transporter receptor subunit TctC